MLIICDKRLPQSAKLKLSKYGEVVEFLTNEIVYEAISGHPDIFFHAFESSIIYAPNTPSEYLKNIENTEFQMIAGEIALGKNYPTTALYNAVANENELFCNKNIIDKSVLKLHNRKRVVHFNQGYSACNIVVGKKSMLTSDLGICKKTNSQYFNPKDIILEGANNGFIGGCCSVFDDKLFIIGALKFVRESQIIIDFASTNELEIIELYQGKLIDGGGIIWI